ncbi:MAG: Ig-like domain-containing protein, partial [Anaerolineae bacterium]
MNRSLRGDSWRAWWLRLTALALVLMLVLPGAALARPLADEGAFVPAGDEGPGGEPGEVLDLGDPGDGVAVGEPGDGEDLGEPGDGEDLGDPGDSQDLGDPGDSQDLGDPGDSEDVLAAAGDPPEGEVEAQTFDSSHVDPSYNACASTICFTVDVDNDYDEPWRQHRVWLWAPGASTDGPATKEYKWTGGDVNTPVCWGIVPPAGESDWTIKLQTLKWLIVWYWDTVDTDVVTVTPTSPPDAADDSYSTDEDMALNVGAPGVLGNDTGESVFVSAVGDGVDHGTLVINADGSFTYTPAANFCGTDSFSYQVQNECGADVATVSIEVAPVNDAPTADDDSFTTDEDTPVSGTLTGSDPEGGALTFELKDGPEHGSLDLNEETGAFTYTPYADWCGDDSFTFY